jgi:arginase family enzyme
MFIRRAGPEPVTLISFDNHPDWDIRPPYWSCGGWAARALRGGAEKVIVWGCGNFELRFPSRLFADRKALKSGQMEIHPWAERQSDGVCRRFNCMGRKDWRARFEEFAKSLADRRIYVTVDMDCLRTGEAVTNWENGLFTAEDVAWAISLLRENARLVASDLCGAWSKPEYERWGQTIAGKWDHPKLSEPEPGHGREVNLRSVREILKALT